LQRLVLLGIGNHEIARNQTIKQSGLQIREIAELPSGQSPIGPRKPEDVAENCACDAQTNPAVRSLDGGQEKNRDEAWGQIQQRLALSQTWNTNSGPAIEALTVGRDSAKDRNHALKSTK